MLLLLATILPVPSRFFIVLFDCSPGFPFEARSELDRDFGAGREGLLLHVV